MIQSIRNFRDWWYVETDNYIFVSNQTDRRAMTRLRTELENAREVFADYFPLKIPLQSVSVVRIFNKRDQYKEYVGADHAVVGRHLDACATGAGHLSAGPRRPAIRSSR